jgi:hypothetical protein
MIPRPLNRRGRTNDMITDMLRIVRKNFRINIAASCLVNVYSGGFDKTAGT